jgi:hypothetical protein
MKDYLFIIIVFIIISCNNTIKKQRDNLNTEDITYIKADSCITSELYKCLYSYLHSPEIGFIEGQIVYRSVYFFKKDTTNYFTIWSSIIEPQYMIEYENIGGDVILDFYHFKIDNADVFLIKQNTYDTDIYKLCIEKFDNDVTKDSIAWDYDGRLFIQTYKYHKIGGKFNIEKLDKPIVDFLGNPTERFW